MLKKWAGILNRRPWMVVAAWIGIAILSGVYGLGVFSKLQGGGFRDPNSESTAVSTVIADKFGKQQVQLVALFSSSSLSVTDPAYKAQAQERIDAIKAKSHVSRVTSFYETGQSSFVSKDGHQTFAAITLDGTSAEQTKVYEELTAMENPADLTVEYGGSTAINAQINGQINKDLAHAESLSFPILAFLLLFVFRSFIAATLPLLIGGLSILGAFLIVRILTSFMDISVYSINVITLLGLGLAVDYSLFMVSRFREELKRGKGVQDAIGISLATAGRTVLFSGTTVILSLLGLLVFPQSFLKSMAVGGASSVLVAMLLALTILPAILCLLGKSINKYPVPFFGKGLHAPATEQGVWYRFSYWVMRQPALVLVTSLAILIALTVPFANAKFSTADVSTVPKEFSSRQVSDALDQNFGTGNSQPVTILVHAEGSPLAAANLSAIREYADRLAKVEGVVRVVTVETDAASSAIPAEQAAQALAAPKAQPLVERYVAGQDELISVYQDAAPQSADAQEVVKALRGVAAPAGMQARIGGESADLTDLLASLRSHLPLAAGLVAIATAILLFLMLGSVVVPIKAIILNLFSLGAAFGVMTAIFQHDNVATFFHVTANGSIDATQPVLIFAIAFGLAMDYELFLLSRIKEAYDQTGDNAQAIAVGIQKTASIITSAALLLVVVIGLFATGKISLIQQIGVGLGFAVAVDATLVRMLLVPSAMRLLGHWNWWAPKPLARLSERLGLKD